MNHELCLDPPIGINCNRGTRVIYNAVNCRSRDYWNMSLLAIIGAYFAVIKN